MQGDIAAGDMSYNSETMNGNTNNTETKINTDNNTDREQCSNQNQESSQQQQPTPIKPYPNFLPWKMGACSPETSLTTSISILNISVAPTAATVGSLTPSPSPEDNVRAKAAVEVNATNDNSYNKKEPAFEIGMSVRESPSPIIAPTAAPSFIPNLPLLEPNHLQLQEQQLTKELYDDRLFNLGLTQPDGPLGMVLEAACTSMGYDIAEMWLRTGPKTHQLIQSHLRYAALDETTREAVVEVYYGERASSFHHKLSPAMCKKARATNNVVWVTSQTSHGSQALLCSLSGVKAAVAVPVCHEQSQTDMTLIYFSMREMRVQPVATEFLTHMSLSAAILSVNVFDPSLLKQRRRASRRGSHMTDMGADDVIHEDDEYEINDNNSLMQKSIQRKVQSINVRTQLSENYNAASTVGDDSAYYNDDDTSSYYPKSVATAPHLSGRRRMSEPPRNLQHHPPQYPVSNIITNTANLQQYPPPISNIVTTTPEYSANGANLNIDWNDLRNVEYLTDGGNNWIHTSVFNNGPSVIKQLKPEVADVVSAMDEIEGELKIHSQLDHRNIVTFQGAGYDRKGKRFLVMERLDGGTLSQLMGYDTRIRDRRRRFFTKKKKLPYRTVLSYAQQIAAAMDYLHRNAVEGGMVVHRDLKPDNIGFSYDKKIVKLIDFGLSTLIPDSSAESNEAYELSGETGSLRYMAPEVGKRQVYNHKADVYSFGIMLWELIAFRKPFANMNKEEFYTKVIHGGYRPEISKKMPQDMAKLIRNCWDVDPEVRPTFKDILLVLAESTSYEKSEKNGEGGIGRRFVKKLTSPGTRHSTWF